MMKTFEMGGRTNRMLAILAQADTLKIKLPASVLEKRSRGEKLKDLVRPITAEEIANATDETVGELVQRVRDNASYQTPVAAQELTRLRDSLDLDLYNTVAQCVWKIYNDVAAKLDKLFVKVNTTAAKVPHAFATNPGTWEHYDDATRNALTLLRKQAAELIGLGTLLDRISEEFFPALPAPVEIAALGSLHSFYDFGDLNSPTLARFELPNAGSLDIETITYLAERGVTLHAQTIKDRKATEQALIDQAKGYAQLDDGRLVPVNEAPIRRDAVNAPPAYVNTSMGEVKASGVTPYM